jgi:SpoVK/Ycf46/Vps4 family AAA+-type ATPase
LGATNRPDRIDPAMKRPGRFSLQFLLFPPNEEERQDIFIVMFDKRLKILHQIKNFSQAVAKTKDPVTGRGYTGAEIELICSWSKDIAESKGRKSVTEKDLLEAIDDFRPTRDPSYELMTLLAVQCCNSKRQIPEPYCSMSDEEINKNIYELRVRLGNVFPGI